MTQLRDVKVSDTQARKILLEGLRWKYHGRDYQSLLHLDLFSVIEHQLEEVQLFLTEKTEVKGLS